MRFKRRLTIEKGHLDIAPLIDVIFLLLIFFMLTSSFIFQPGIKVDLPKAVTSEVIHEKNLNIVVKKDNSVYVDERRLDRDELLSRLRIASKSEKPILIKADRKASLDRIVYIWDLCRQEGVKKINIATTQKRP